MVKRIMPVVFTVIILIGLSACSVLDVIGDHSIKSFEALLSKLGAQVKEDEGFGGWSLESPDGEVRFLWSKDFSKTTPYDIYLEVNAQPFLDAGLEIEKLPENMLVGNKLLLGTDLGSNELTYNEDITPLASYKKIVELYRYHITYHAAMDHFGVDLENGNVMEWAKDMTTNDKDLVFVLNPEVFINAGADPNQIEGWIFAKVSTMDEKGNEIELDKLLKPFNLDGKDESTGGK